MLTARPWRMRAVAVAIASLAAVPVALLAPAPAHAGLVRGSQQWVLNELNLPAAWVRTEGRGVTVAVLDSGVNPSVSDLVGSVTTGPDFTGVHTPSSNPNWGVHGTWMASLVAGHGHGPDGANGILGSAPQARILSIRVITDSSDPNNLKYEQEPPARGQAELAQAITYAVSHGAGVISMSLGYSLQSRPVRAALQYAYDHNVVVVASAGNSGDARGAEGTGQAPYSFPADYPGVLAVAAVTRAGKVASFSSENLSVQVAAPGDRVPAQGRDGTYWYVSGTSPACALTAGVVALIKSAYPHLTDAQVISAITSSTTPSTRPPGGWDQQIGFGVVNAAGALAAAARIAAAPPPAAGVAVQGHFGGGPRAVPAAPVSPRGAGPLVGYCLLGLACLGVVALATSKLLGPGGGSRASGGRLAEAAPSSPVDQASAAHQAASPGHAGPAQHAGPGQHARQARPARPPGPASEAEASHRDRGEGRTGWAGFTVPEQPASPAPPAPGGAPHGSGSDQAASS